MGKKKILNDSSMVFLENYINNASPVGYEDAGQKMWLEYLKPWIDEHFLDNYGTVVGVINPDAKYKVVIEAHADEIAWRVNYISSEGFVHVIRNGGSDHQIAPSKHVNLYGEKGVVKGVFGWPAIHMRDDKNEDPPTLKNIFIDVGCESKEEVEEKGILPGTVVTFNDPFTVLNEKYFTGRALDNRLGGFIIAEVVRMLHENKKKLPFGLYITNSVQEEVGLRGAQMIAQTIKPDVALVTDVSHDTSTPKINKVIQGDMRCGKGPILAFAPSVQRNLLKLILDAATKNNIPYQRRASGSATGTDTDAFAFSNGGVPSALISIPLRYMHTTVEMAHMDDVENVIRLFYHSLLQIKDGHNFKYF